MFKYVVLLVLIAGCVDPSTQGKESSGKPTWGTFKTVEFEGHKYLMYEDGYRAGLEHHPDCPCNK